MLYTLFRLGTTAQKPRSDTKGMKTRQILNVDKSSWYFKKHVSVIAEMKRKRVLCDFVFHCTLFAKLRFKSTSLWEVTVLKNIGL